MKIHTSTGGPAATNGYLIVDEDAKIGAIIDAPQEATARLIDVARRDGLTIPYLILTHGHWDHTADHALVTEAFPDAKVLIHRADEPQLEMPDLFFPLYFPIPARQADGYLNEGETLRIGGMAFAIMHTPGHSPGLVVLHEPTQHLLIAGDLIFAGSVGRTDFPGCDAKAMSASLQRVLALPDETVIFSGHGPQTTMGKERRTNPFLKRVGT
jgi:hydroxyacylglutathione hydrolase